MEEINVGSIELETFCHATEDQEKVVEAVLNLVPPELKRQARRKIKITTIKGHHGNPIKIIRLKISKPGKARKTLTHILSQLEEGEAQYIAQTLPQRTDGSHIYIRLDKQRAYLQAPLTLAKEDVIKVKIALTRPITLQKLEEALRNPPQKHIENHF